MTKLILTFQPDAYSGDDLKQVYPQDLARKYTTTVGFKWRRSDMGPESWSLTIAVGYALGKLVGGVLEELSKDLYKWMKESVLKVVRERKNNYGAIYIDCGDVWIEFVSFFPNDEVLGLLEQLPELLADVDTNLCEDWSVEYSDGKYNLSPNRHSVRQRLTTNTARDVDDVLVDGLISRWQEDRYNDPGESGPRD